MKATTRISKDERRREIIEAATREFAVGGLNGTPVDAIAKRVDVRGDPGLVEDARQGGQVADPKVDADADAVGHHLEFPDVGLEPFVELLLQVDKVITVPGGPALPKEVHTDLVSVDHDILDPEPGDLTVTESVEQGELDHEEVPSCSLPLEIHQVRPELLHVSIGERIPNRLTWRPFNFELDSFADIRINPHGETGLEIDVVIKESEETL